MTPNPAADWRALAEHYRGLYDEELERLADDFSDLTPTAQQALRSEMGNRGLGDPSAPARPRAEDRAPVRFASSVDPDSLVNDSENDNGAQEPSGGEFTWKTDLCECETTEQAWQLQMALKRAEIDCWVANAGSRYGGFPKLLVAADQMEQARQIAQQPIPQDLVDEYRESLEAPEYELPCCPACGAEDPTLEAAEPTNNWLCEVCGRQWSEQPLEGADTTQAR